MTTQGFKQLTETRDLHLGTYIGEFATPGIGAILKAAGCDFAFLDMEHSGFSFETAKAVLRNLHDAGLATLLRPPSHATHHISRACDIGGQAICPPMMGTADQAQAVIDAINYPPKGTRGAAFAIAHDDYTPRGVADAIAYANARTSFVALIETAAGIENVEAIAALEGCDCLWIGHFDLSNSLGIPGQGVISRVEPRAPSTEPDPRFHPRQTHFSSGRSRRFAWALSYA